MMTPSEKANQWLNSDIDQESKAEIQQLLNNEDDTELVESFYKDLEFGTGGLRGIMGIGSNRMNKYTVGMATQGLSNYLLKVFEGQEIRVAIAHDCRNKSDYFADIAASIFSSNGIQVYFFKELRPTPELSYAVRHFKCKSGLVITASHNPREYNGYKAYWDDGAQVTPPHDSNIIEEVNKIAGFDEVKFEKDSSKIEVIDKEFDQIYIDEIKSRVLDSDAIIRQKDLKIVFSSIHGTGITLVPQALEQIGFTNVEIIEEQATPDGNFPTVVYPNPEEAEALTLALKKAAEIDADLVMATDPDADRVGIAVKNNHNEFQLLNGNQTAALMTEYLLRQWKAHGKLDGNQYIVKTIVTTDLLDIIAKKYHVECFNTLTGFKYIAMIIRELEGVKEFIGGGEESYGFMVGDYVRDKDAVSACAVIAEMAAVAGDQGKTVFDTLLDIYSKYGFYQERLISITKKGKSGAEEITEMMVNMRGNPPERINRSPLITIRNYQSSLETNVVTGSASKLDFPASNVLQYFTEDGSKISARPSGTEPKIKFYISVNVPLPEVAMFDEVQEKLNRRIDNIIVDMNLK